MLLKILLLYCSFASSFAWLAPERCSQDTHRHRRSFTDASGRINTVKNIAEIATQQHEDTVKAHENYRFLGVPIRITPFESFPENMPRALKVHTPYNCSFYTYEPRLLASISCDAGISCKLSQSVATVDTYTSSEGYNWGAKISTKWTIIEKVFEIGAEVSSGGTYTCTYTKGKTTTTLAECSDATLGGGHLRLYNVKTDMKCDFGEVVYNSDYRGPPEDQRFFFVVDDRLNYFTREEIAELKSCVQAKVQYKVLPYMLDTDKISDSLLQKLMRKAPFYDPFTDLLSIDSDNIVVVIYYKIDESTRKYDLSRFVPFTNRDGDSVYQYACKREPF